MKFGIFSDSTTRDYDQDSFSNFNDNSAYYEGPWSDYWSRVFPYENHPVTAAILMLITRDSRISLRHIICSMGRSIHISVL